MFLRWLFAPISYVFHVKTFQAFEFCEVLCKMRSSGFMFLWDTLGMLQTMMLQSVTVHFKNTRS